MNTTLVKVPAVGSFAPDVIVGSAIEGQKLSAFRGDPVVILFLGDHWDPAQGQLLQVCRQVLETVSEGVYIQIITDETRLFELDFESQSTVQFPMAGNP